MALNAMSALWSLFHEHYNYTNIFSYVRSNVLPPNIFSYVRTTNPSHGGGSIFGTMALLVNGGRRRVAPPDAALRGVLRLTLK